MIAGASWVWWLGFHAIVAALLFADTLLHGRRHDSGHAKTAVWLWTALLVAAAAGFAAWIAHTRGHQPALEFATGYVIEMSLSVDNLFVFLVIFQAFSISPQRQRDALRWGVAGAVLLRALCIAAGIALLRRFEWVTWVLGLVLLYAAWRLLRVGPARVAIPKAPAAVCTLTRWLQPGKRLRLGEGSLLPVILAIECSDILFAMDSIPAVLAVSHDPFVVYTSNIAAVLGLRSLYSALAALLDRFRSLHYGLGVLLAFVALKMIASRWIEVPITLSLAVVGAILAVSAVVSWRSQGGKQGSASSF
jgi:tellurite resistance protein TerC